MAWSYEELLDLIVGAEAFHDGSGLASDVGAQALDKSTLEIRLTRPASYFDVIANTWTMVALPEWLIEAEGGAWTETGNFQGYGPYVLKEWEHNSQMTRPQHCLRCPWPGSGSYTCGLAGRRTWPMWLSYTFANSARNRIHL